MSQCNLYNKRVKGVEKIERVKREKNYRVPFKSWYRDIEANALAQAVDLACHPMVFHHVALMPDCHLGYGMPIGGVIVSREAVIPNAVGVDIGCGMGQYEHPLQHPSQLCGAGRVMRRKQVSRSLMPETCDQPSSAISSSWLIVIASTTLWAAGHSVM